jgi:DNA-nicking Smr family endonuclease
MSAGGGRKKNGPPEDPLFRQSVADVTPIARRDKVELARPRAPAKRRAPAPSPAEAFDNLSDHVPWQPDESGATAFLRPGMQRQTLRNLRRGHYKARGELDLHGYTSAEARRELAVFLERCIEAGARCVRIIHGRGLRSDRSGPVLKRKVAAWLAQRDEVLAYCEARPEDGGAGAVMVLLKTMARER